MLSKDSKIYIAGHRGLVGSAIMDNLARRGFTRLVGRTHAELDLLDPVAVRQFFDTERPDAVVLAAAHVGGIMANSRYRADFIYRNLQIQQNVIGEAWRHGVQRLLFLGSTCIYPREAPQPIPEDALLTSPLEYTNEPYAIAKIAGLKLCESLNLQYGTDYIAVMPTNLYGPRDNFDLTNSHVLPAMMRKMHLARLLAEGDTDALRADLTRRPLPGLDAAGATHAGIADALAACGIYADRLELWGTGRPLREFLWSEDMADASVHILLNVSFADLCTPGTDIRNTHINIGTGTELTIAELAAMIRSRVGFRGDIRWDASKPDGTMRKLCDVSKLHSLGWRHSVDLPQGIDRLYTWYLAN
ncbi:MAG: GDP-L-fucose synthase [Bacteroides sp.]|nr:GDP-L-fucose synthase [Bacteroides sp.]MCM1095047.1 GDP-L-fucose synthase [Terasakiella sp.]